MFNPSSTCFSIQSYPLTEVSTFNSISLRTNNDPVTTNDYSSYYSHTTSSSPLDHSNPTNTDRHSSSLFQFRSSRCLVCNDRSSGIHFGVSTCEACKAFFRRTNLSSYSISLPCSPNRCEINVKNRNNCPSCRFDKCKRLGMDRDNVIYGKPSKRQIHHQDYYIEQLANTSNELIKIFHNIHSNYHISLDSFENKQQIDAFGQIVFQFFYLQTSPTHLNPSDIIHRILILFYKNILIMDYCFTQNINLRAILCVWLFVYYYETFLFKQKLSQDKLTTLIKLLDMEMAKLHDDYDQIENKEKFFRIDFLNTFSKYTDLLQEIHQTN